MGYNTEQLANDASDFEVETNIEEYVAYPFDWNAESDYELALRSLCYRHPFRNFEIIGLLTTWLNQQSTIRDKFTKGYL